MYSFKYIIGLWSGVLFLLFVPHCSGGEQKQEKSHPVEAGQYTEYSTESKREQEEQAEEIRENRSEEQQECNSDKECDFILENIQSRVTKCVNHRCEFLRCPSSECRLGYCGSEYCLTCSATCSKDADCMSHYFCKHYGYNRLCTGCFPRRSP